MSKRKTLPEFDSYQKASDWLDGYSTSDLESAEVHFDIASPLQIQIIDSLNELAETIVVDKQLGEQIRQIAQKEGVSTQELLRKWLLEKVGPLQT